MTKSSLGSVPVGPILALKLADSVFSGAKLARKFVRNGDCLLCAFFCDWGGAMELG
jgi:hypothetical protein